MRSVSAQSVARSMRRSTGDSSVSTSKELMSFFTTVKSVSRSGLRRRAGPSPARVRRRRRGLGAKDLGSKADGKAVREGIIGEIAAVILVHARGKSRVKKRAIAEEVEHVILPLSDALASASRSSAVVHVSRTITRDPAR